MATPNFPRVNASKIYAFGMNQYYTADAIDALGLDECMEGEYSAALTYECFEDDISTVKDSFTDKGWDRGSGRDTIATKSVDITYGDELITLDVEACAREGYYEGACFDWVITMSINGCDPVDISGKFEPVMLSWFDFDVENLDVWHDNKDSIFTEVSNRRDSLIKEAEEVFSEVAIPLKVLAIASNGEAFYEPA